MSEKLSALIDGELTEHEQRQLLRDLLQDGALQAAWGRYHLLRAALRAEEHGTPTAIAGRVRSALANEAAYAAGSASGRTFKFAGTVAIAATVAAMTIVGLQNILAPPAATGPLAQAPAPVRTVQTIRWERQKPETERVLNIYLVEHSDFAPTNGVSGMLGPNVRVVAYDRNP